jgi:YjbE family integral membrane protein
VNSEFWVSLVNIVIIDLVLSGDNAVVIAMAVQHLPAELRTRAAIIGAAGAVGLRVIFTALVAILTGIPLVQAIGALALFWIAYKLLIETEQDAHAHREVHGFWDAVKIIVLADVVMSLDNVLAIGGAAHGDLGLLLFGLLLSIPLVLFGSSLLTSLLRKWPALSYVGAGVLAWTAGKMLVHDRVVAGWLDAAKMPHVEAVLPLAATAVLLVAGYLVSRRQAPDTAREEVPA